MHIIIVRNYKKKIIIFITVLIFWFLLFSMTSMILKDKLVYHLTINSFLSFSYPVKYEIDDIYVNESLRNNAIETNFTFKRAIIGDYSNFESESGKFGFKYPSSFTLSQKEFSGSDILYHIDFHSTSKDSIGFIQVWNMSSDLGEFLKRSKKLSQQNFMNFKEKSLSIHNLPGYLWDYSVKMDDSNTIKGMEVFLKDKDRMYRISYFTHLKNWSKEQSNIFWSIVASLKTK